MAGVNTIVKLGLEAEALALKAQIPPLSDPAIARALSELAGQTISRDAVARFFKASVSGAVAVVHQPAVAEQAARSVFNVLDELDRSYAVVHELVDLARGADTLETTCPHCRATFRIPVPDLPVAARLLGEQRGHLETAAKLLERLYNAREIAVFQETVLEVVAAVAPEVRTAIIQELRRRHPATRDWKGSFRGARDAS